MFIRPSPRLVNGIIVQASWAPAQARERITGLELFTGRHVNAGFSAVQGVESAIYIHRSIAAGEALFRTLFGFACAFNVDL
jgi:hypothetical protein